MENVKDAPGEIDEWFQQWPLVCTSLGITGLTPESLLALGEAHSSNLVDLGDKIGEWREGRYGWKEVEEECGELERMEYGMNEWQMDRH